jgi:hypothetical protein
MKIRRSVEVAVSSTHIDSQNERFTIEALHSMEQQAKERKVWVTLDHDPLMPPLGFIESTRIEKLDDGEYALVAKKSLFDFDYYPYINKPTEISNLLYPNSPEKESENYINITFNPHNVDFNSEKISKIGELDVVIENAVEKSSEPPWWIALLIAPLFDGFIKGFIQEFTGKSLEDLGKDFAIYLKSNLNQFKENVAESCEKGKKLNPNRQFYLIYEFKVKNATCSAFIILKNKERSKIFQEISSAEDNLLEFVCLCQKLVQKNGDLEELKLAFIPNHGWEISYAITQSGNILVGELGQQGLQKIKAHVP